MSKVLVAGYGSAGQYVVDFLLKDHRISQIEEIHIMSRKSEIEVTPRIDISRVSAGLSERFIPIIYHQCDFNNVESMAQTIYEVSPEVVVYTGRYASGLKYGAFSYPNNIGYGVWMPMSFPYIYKLMKAVKVSGVSTKVINTSFPDGVNYLLSQINLAPYCGAGNINHLIPRIKRATSEMYRVPMNEVVVKLACAHYVNTYVSKEGSERKGASLLKVNYGDRVLINDESIDKQDPRKEELFNKCKDNSAGGQIRNQMIATDCAEIVRILLNKDSYSKEIIHIPGVSGLPGGRTCIGTCGMLVPEELSWSLGEINEVNLIGLKNDGVVIVDDGICFTQEVVDKMKSVFDLDYPSKLKVDDIQPFADEIYSKLKEVAKK